MLSDLDMPTLTAEEAVFICPQTKLPLRAMSLDKAKEALGSANLVSRTNADPTPSPSVSPSTPGQQQKPDGPGKGGFGPRGEFGLGGALHGEFVVPKDGGGYQTIATQRGSVTAVSRIRTSRSR